MKAVVLCGGLGTRLGLLTCFIPKPLLPVGGRPIIDYILDDLVSADVSPDIDDVVLATNSALSDQFRYWAMSASRRSRLPLKIIEEPLEKVRSLGAVGSIKWTIEEAAIEDDVLILAGDNLYDFSVKAMIDDFKKYGRSVIGCYDVGSRENARRFGVVEIDSEKIIVSFEEKPSEPKSQLISTALYLFRKHDLNLLDGYLADERNVREATGHFAGWLSRIVALTGHAYTGKWYDVGTLATYRMVFDEYGSKGNGRSLAASLYEEWYERFKGRSSELVEK